MRTYGTIKRAANGAGWALAMEPHVALRFKRMFPSVKPGPANVLFLSSTDAACRDLEWFMDRYPLEFDPPELRHGLLEQARLFDAYVEQAHAIMTGNYEAIATEMELPPRDYQRQAADLCRLTGGLLVADELGLGKTVTGITLIADQAHRPAIIVVPTHLQKQWAREIARFLPTLKVHTAQKMDPGYIAPLFDSWPPDVLIITYHKIVGWRDVLSSGWQSVVFDECQELRRSFSDKYNAAAAIAASVKVRCGLSATPIFNYGAEFYNVIDILRPDSLGTRSEFTTEWCGFSHDEHKARILQPKAFGTFLRENSLMVRRTRADVGRELPPLTNVVHEFEPDPTALNQVETRAQELARVLLSQGTGIVKMQAAEELSNAVRQATGIAKARYVAEFTKMLIAESDEPVILFGWHRAVYEIWAEEFKDLEPAWYTGSESPAAKDKEKERFMNGSTKLMIISLRAGSGLDGLQKVCYRGVYGELDWSPGVHEQCTGRFHRDGQTEPSIAYYPVATSGSDPIVLDVLGVKRGQIERVRDPEAEIAIPKQTDPNHIKRLAEAYLLKRHTKPSEE